MADTYYAWSNFKDVVADLAKPDVKTSFKPGDVVTKEKLGVDQDNWDALVESGAVRVKKYPDMGNYEGSPREYRLEQLAAAAKGEEFDVVADMAPEKGPIELPAK